MNRRALVLLTITAMSWGASFALIKFALAELEPSVVMAARCVIGILVLWPFVLVQRGRTAANVEHDVSRPGDHGALLLNGVMTGVPFFLVAWGVQSVDSGIAGVINASVPVWAALLAIRLDPGAPVTRRTLAGVGVGFAGVFMLFALRGALEGRAAVHGLAACCAAAFIYAISGIFVRRRLAHRASSVVASWSVTWGAVVLLIGTVGAWPHHIPSGSVVIATVVLGIVGTGIGMLAYYELLAVAGAARASLVTYLLPPLAIVWGVLLLGERIRIDEVLAMLLILAGVWLGSGSARASAVDHV